MALPVLSSNSYVNTILCKTLLLFEYMVDGCKYDISDFAVRDMNGLFACNGLQMTRTTAQVDHLNHP